MAAHEGEDEDGLGLRSGVDLVDEVGDDAVAAAGALQGVEEVVLAVAWDGGDLCGNEEKLDFLKKNFKTTST